MPQWRSDRAATIDYSVLGPEDSRLPRVLFSARHPGRQRLWEPRDESMRGRVPMLLPNWPLGSHTNPVNDAGAL